MNLKELLLNAHKTISLSKANTKRIRMKYTCFIFSSLNSTRSSRSQEENYFIKYVVLLQEGNNINLLRRLFYGSTDLSGQAKEEDIIQIIRIIDILIRKSSSQGQEAKNSDDQYTLHLASALCNLLLPILRYGTPAVNKIFQNERCLTKKVIQLISYMDETRTNDDMIESCLELYSELKRVRCTQKSSKEALNSMINDQDTLRDYQKLHEGTAVHSNDGSQTSTSCEEIIKMHCDVWKKFQRLIFDQKKSIKKEMLEKMLEDERKKLDLLNTKCNYEILDQQYQAAMEQIKQNKEELERSNIEQERLQREMTKLQRKLNEQDRKPITGMIAEKTLIEPINIDDEIVFELDKLSPAAISPEQSKRFIREIYRRRTTFRDADMRKSICGSLKQLGSDLYGSSVHFVHEIIQVNHLKSSRI